MAKESAQGVNIFTAGVATCDPFPDSVDCACHALPPLGDEGTAVISRIASLTLKKRPRQIKEKYDEPWLDA